MKNKDFEEASADKAAILNAVLKLVQTTSDYDAQTQIELDALSSAYQDAIQRQKDADKD